MASIKYVEAKGKRWTCPGCEYATDKIVNLREHVGRHHDFRLTTVSTWHLTKEQKKRLKNKGDRERKRRKTKQKRTVLFGIDAALTRGTFQCQEPMVIYKKSSIPNAGNGVFANTDIPTDHAITVYSGEKVDDKPNCSEYVIQLQDGSYVIGNSTPQVRNGLGSFINRSAANKNCEIEEDEDYQLLIIVAAKNIKKGDELFTTYSRGYRLRRQKTQTRQSILNFGSWLC
jgi:SET domain